MVNVIYEQESTVEEHSESIGKIVRIESHSDKNRTEVHTIIKKEKSQFLIRSKVFLYSDQSMVRNSR